ncbi:MAG: SDR family oxidoreductase [Herpetosiphonaceae bacterium]|nr:SDR family oxidoreductase [Herpetosiphonaceae bacterium]
MDSLAGKVVLVTGASRGIGASVVRMVAERGADVVINYRSKGPRAQVVADGVLAIGRRTLLAQADITAAADVQTMVAAVAKQFGRLDRLVLNASGGLEKNKSADYAMQLNQVAQERLVEAFLPLLVDGGRIVFITSHLAHFYGQKPVYAGYETVAASKHAGEQALRSRIPALAERGISLVVVSGDLIEGTITPKLMARAQPGLIEYRREQAGALPTVEDFALAIAEACADSTLASGATVYIGSTE